MSGTAIMMSALVGAALAYLLGYWNGSLTRPNPKADPSPSPVTHVLPKNLPWGEVIAASQAFNVNDLVVHGIGGPKYHVCDPTGKGGAKALARIVE